MLASFGQGSNSIKSAEQGAGLGLPIAKNLIDLHGGTFTLKSKLRIGTEVIVTFPPERVMSALAPIADGAPPIQPHADVVILRRRTRRARRRCSARPARDVRPRISSPARRALFSETRLTALRRSKPSLRDAGRARLARDGGMPMSAMSRRAPTAVVGSAGRPVDRDSRSLIARRGEGTVGPLSSGDFVSLAYKIALLVFVGGTVLIAVPRALCAGAHRRAALGRHWPCSWWSAIPIGSNCAMSPTGCWRNSCPAM